MAHTPTAVLAVATVLLLLVGRRCGGGAAHRSCARRCSSRRDALTGAGFSTVDPAGAHGRASGGVIGGRSSGPGHTGPSC